MMRPDSSDPGTYSAPHVRTWAGLLGVAASAAASTVLVSDLLAATGVAEARLERRNFHGRPVSLRGGLAAAAGSVLTAVSARTVLRHTAGGARTPAACAALLAGAAGGGAGLLDDLDAGAHDGEAPAKGLKGHLGALRHGHVTTGALKIIIIGSGALAGGALLAGERPTSRQSPGVVATETLLNGVIIASWANVHNLLDLRPGRALKTAGLLAAVLAASPGGATATRLLSGGVLGVAAAALPEDLGEATMLGDTGANAVGAVVGTALAAHPRTAVRLAAAVTGTALVLASERVSFSRVIDSTPMLAAVDALGRRP